MTRSPTLDEVFQVMAKASVGDPARVELPTEPDPSDAATRLAIALNLLLDDLEYRARMQRELEEQLRQTHKLEAIGRLAGGIAHDFNNLLSVIIGNAELARQDLVPDGPGYEEVEQIEFAAARAAELTRQLLAFGRKQLFHFTAVDLSEIVRGMTGMLERLLGEQIELATFSTTPLGNVLVDRSQFEQIIMNLVVNARDAMPEGGKLTIETQNVELDAAYAAKHQDVTPGQYVMLAVTDTGMGMDPAVCEHIFEPFFTTKEQGSGTGLGLATVFGIVKQSKGHIWVYSELGSHTCFKVYLPRTDEVAEQPRPVVQESEIVDGTETILLAEDEAPLRALIGTILERNGYHVLRAANGTEALRICEQFEGKIHLVVTDVVMPDMNGKQLANRIVSQRPEIKILYMSGYTDNTIVHHGILDPGVAFIPKPIKSSPLLRKVREVINSQ